MTTATTPSLNQLLQKYKTVPKAHPPNKHKSTASLAPPKTSPLSIPFPKSYKPKSTTSHPMLLQRQHLIPTPYTAFINYKSQAAQYLPLKAFHLFNEDGKHLNIDTLLKKDPQIWNPSLSNEIGCLTQGI